MGKYIGRIEKIDNYFNFNPLAEICDGQIKILTDKEKERLLVNSPKPVINFSSYKDIENIEIIAKEKILVIHEFETKNLSTRNYSDYRYFETEPKIYYMDIDILKDISNSNVSLNNEFEKLKKEHMYLEKFKHVVQEREQDKIENEIKDNSYESFADVIQHIENVFEKRGYNYDKKILMSFYLGLQTDQLILLMGKPGSGKTSLVREFAEVFGIEYENIAVQANWADKSDLLGYYNPIDKNYVSTPFLDCLMDFCRVADKKENEDKLYFICLDEMNLSHIEYYFADFLSVLQEPNPEERKIKLYSKYLCENILQELECFGFVDTNIKEIIESQKSLSTEKFEEINGNLKSHEDILKMKYYFDLCRSLKMLKEFPYEIKIPKNIKFIGTLNQDETTLDISPKVIDRSYIIRFNDNKVKVQKAGSDHGNSVYESIKYKRIKDYIKNENDSKASKKVLDLLYADNIRKEIHFSKRIEKQTFSHNEYEDWCMKMGEDEVDDLLIASTVLPRIRIDKEDVGNVISDIEKGMEELLKEHPKSKEIYTEIDDKDFIYFWS
ncbi:MAG: AAA family ATPase [Acidaminococcaceae bacterium]|nr:AAA family ATPase [Acidaminococcaceae bacterium]